jgi:hypothetical protein
VYRGGLIFTFLAELYQLDRRGQAPSSPVQMDEDFREPVRVDRNGDGIGEERRRELPPVYVPCQVEPKKFEEQRQLSSGNSPDSALELVMHFVDLERLGLVDQGGNAVIAVGDRLGGIYTRSMRPEWTVRNPPGLFVAEVRPLGFGLSLSRPRRNLLMVVFRERALGPL